MMWKRRRTEGVKVTQRGSRIRTSVNIRVEIWRRFWDFHIFSPPPRLLRAKLLIPLPELVKKKRKRRKEEISTTVLNNIKDKIKDLVLDSDFDQEMEKKREKN